MVSKGLIILGNTQADQTPCCQSEASVGPRIYIEESQLVLPYRTDAQAEPLIIVLYENTEQSFFLGRQIR